MEADVSLFLNLAVGGNQAPPGENINIRWQRDAAPRIYLP